MFGLQKNRVFGLDIGSSAVKIVQLGRSEAGFVVSGAGIAEIASSAEDSEEGREINIVRAIRNCLRSTGIRTRFAVCGVCGPEVAVRYFTFPSLLPEEIEGAILLEAAQVCPFNIDEGVVDYQLIPSGDGNVTGVLVAVTNRLISAKRRLIKEASLSNVLTDVDGLALLNCLSEYEEQEPGRTTAVLNIGSSFTTLAVMSDNTLPFVRDMAYAGNDIIKKIANEHDVSTDIVKDILSGREGPEQPELELGESLAKACQKLVADVTETLRYYAAQGKPGFVERIFVCGGFAPVKGFVELLNSQLPTATVLWNPFDKISCNAGRRCRDILEKNGPAMVVATGLAMRSI